MSRTYTVRLGGGVMTGGQILVVGRGEVGYQVVVRDVVIYNAGVSESLMYIQIKAGGTYYPIAAELVPTGRMLHWEGRQVIEPGDELVAISMSMSAQCLATGYRFINQ